MKKKIPILLLTRDRPTLLEKVLDRVIKYTDWSQFDLWILDNFSTASNKKIINMFKAHYPFINIYSTYYNQLALIQNEIIAKLKADFYIKIDDDILVSEGWTDGFVGVYERNYKTMSVGSVVMPINGFGWLPFVQIMNLTEEFKQRFPHLELKQFHLEQIVGKPETRDKYLDIIGDKEANVWLWNHCLDLDKTAKTFVQNQNGQYQDLTCPFRYSIGAIVFGHSFWEKMGGWKVQDGYHKRLRLQKIFKKPINKLLALKGEEHERPNTRLHQLADILAGTAQGAMGVEELAVYAYSHHNGYKIQVTTQSIVFHFAFGPVDQHLMNAVYRKIIF